MDAEAESAVYVYSSDTRFHFSRQLGALHAYDPGRISCLDNVSYWIVCIYKDKGQVHPVYLTAMEENNVCIRVENATVRFNKASEKINSLKEYAIKLVKHELMFKEFIALQNINLSICQGESWAFVGPNGAGKSTLLKLICRILTPYTGKVTVRGSIAPMIELGAGFDANLTAEENIYLNGVIMGHSRQFMRDHFEEIVEFAQLQDFLDMPIKNYSSGMRARLGFAVATMVKPDILIVDEVLAVGDASFQKRCNERMQEMLSGGTTLLFVSHSNSAVRALCQNAVWLDHGQIRDIGTADAICSAYESTII